MGFIPKFNELMHSVDAERRTLGQCRPEWQQFMEYAAGYFKNRGLEHPVVVEIGICADAQKRFYREIMGAEHIGIDVDRRTNPNILGDSLKVETIEKLKERLDGRAIDLLFLDGNHTYDYVKFEYENYGPMTQHLIAFHDLVCMEEGIGVEVHRLWQEICAAEKAHCLLTFYRHNDSKTVWPGHEMGIGVIVKGSEG